MGQITTIGFDLAKNVFHVVCCDIHGKLIRKKMLKRSSVLGYFANLPPCLVGMEACASAHYWARKLAALGHQVKLTCRSRILMQPSEDRHDEGRERLGIPQRRRVPLPVHGELAILTRKR